MSGFKTNAGNYKSLGIIVFKYRLVLWSYFFYNTSEEWISLCSKAKFDNPYQWDAQYCFNSEKPLKEQAQYGGESVFAQILKEIIDRELVDKKW